MWRWSDFFIVIVVTLGAMPFLNSTSQAETRSLLLFKKPSVPFNLIKLWTWVSKFWKALSSTPSVNSEIFYTIIWSTNSFIFSNWREDYIVSYWNNPSFEFPIFISQTLKHCQEFESNYYVLNLKFPEQNHTSKLSNRRKSKKCYF